MSSPTVRGTCFGFAVHSALTFEYLRGGEGTPLAISAPSESGKAPDDELIGDWVVNGDVQFHARLFSDGTRFRYWVDRSGWFVIDPNAPSIALPEGEHPIRREERLWGMPALLCYLARGDLPVHAAAVEVDGGAVVLAAPRTFGKTTMAAGFVRAGHRLLSEDLTCLRLEPSPAVVPGPAMLRLREDVAAQLELESGRRLEGPDDRVRVALADEQRGDCTPVPLHSIVFLRPSPGAAHVLPAPVADAIRDLHSLCFHLPGLDARARTFTQVADLVGRVNVVDLAFSHSLERLGDTVDAVVAAGV